MEDSRPGGHSDKDRSMMERSSFENDTDKPEKSKKGKDRRSLRGASLLLGGSGDVPGQSAAGRSRAEELFTRSESSKTTQESEAPKISEVLGEQSSAEAAGEAVEQSVSENQESDEAATVESLEAEVPLESLSDEEIVEATRQLAHQHSVEAATEANEAAAGSEAQTEAAAEARLLENIEQTGSIEEGYRQTLEQLELGNAVEVESAETDSELALTAVEADAVIEASAVIEADTQTEVDDEADDPEPSRTAPVSSPPISVAVSGGGRSGGPAGPPAAPRMSSPAGPEQPAPVWQAAPESGHTVVEVSPRTGRRRAADLLVGGIVGYMLGRRRGRINTEAKLQPVQNKLEKQIRQLEDQMTEKEANIRKLAADKSRRQSIDRARTVRQSAEGQPVILSALPERYDRRLDVSPGSQRERPLASIETSPDQLENIAHVSKNRLLEIAADIKVDGNSLKALYEAGRLDEAGLRRVIGEYWRGERLDVAIVRSTKESNEAEAIGTSRVRDSGGVSGSAGAIAGLAGQAMVSPGESAESQSAGVAIHQGSSPNTSASHSAEQKPSQLQNLAIGIGLLTAIAVLAVLGLLV